MKIARHRGKRAIVAVARRLAVFCIACGFAKALAMKLQLVAAIQNGAKG